MKQEEHGSNQTAPSPFDTSSLEENMKKALTELMVLHLFSIREHYIGELAPQIRELSGCSINIVFPYAVIYRLMRSGYVRELPRRNAPDGRLRQYYQITDEGREYLAAARKSYSAFVGGLDKVLSYKGEKES